MLLPPGITALNHTSSCKRKLAKIWYYSPCPTACSSSFLTDPDFIQFFHLLTPLTLVTRAHHLHASHPPPVLFMPEPTCLSLGSLSQSPGQPPTAASPGPAAPAELLGTSDVVLLQHHNHHIFGLLLGSLVCKHQLAPILVAHKPISLLTFSFYPSSGCPNLSPQINTQLTLK